MNKLRFTTYSLLTAILFTTLLLSACGSENGKNGNDGDSTSADSAVIISDPIDDKHTLRKNNVTGDKIMEMRTWKFEDINRYLWGEMKWRLIERKDVGMGINQATWASDHDTSRIADLITVEWGVDWDPVIVFRTYSLEAYGKVMGTMGLSNYTRAKFLEYEGVEKKCLQDKDSESVVCVRNPSAPDKSQQFVIAVTTSKSLDYIWLESEHITPKEQ